RFDAGAAERHLVGGALGLQRRLGGRGERVRGGEDADGSGRLTEEIAAGQGGHEGSPFRKRPKGFSEKRLLSPPGHATIWPCTFPGEVHDAQTASLARAGCLHCGHFGRARPGADVVARTAAQRRGRDGCQGTEAGVLVVRRVLGPLQAGWPPPGGRAGPLGLRGQPAPGADGPHAAVSRRARGFVAGGDVLETWDGALWLTWENWAPNNEQIWTARSFDGGLNWEKWQVSRFTPPPDGQAKNPQLAAIGWPEFGWVISSSWRA